MLVAFGLLASGIAVTSILRHSLINRVDETLLDASRSWAQAPRRMPTPPIEGPNPARPPSNFYVRGIDPDGRIWMAVNDRAAEPALPADNDVGPGTGHRRLDRPLACPVAGDVGARACAAS